jgi:hypothetical protein
MQHDALGVSRAKPGMSSKENFEFLQYLVAEGNNFFIGR